MDGVHNFKKNWNHVYIESKVTCKISIILNYFKDHK
jgi:hypothetical protein